MESSSSPSRQDERIEPFVAVAMPDIVGAVATTTSNATRTAQATAAQAVNIAQKVKEFVAQKQQWVAEKLERGRQHLQNYGQRAFQFSQTMKAVSLFFPIIVVARMIIGFFQKPLEFIMLGVACIVLAILYVLHFVFSIPPFDWVPFAVYFTIWRIAPLAAYVATFGLLLAAATLLCVVLAGINYVTGGALKKLVLCQNSPAAWYKTPNHHLQNRYERGLMCSRPCKTGYAPDPDTRSTCTKLPASQPSYCPQASVMRSFMKETLLNENGYPDYADAGGWRNAHMSPAEREDAMKDHYLNKRKFLQTCGTTFSGPYRTIPLSVCSAMDAKGSDAVHVSARACAQAYCTTERAYPFCVGPGPLSQGHASGGPWWLRFVHGMVWMSVAAMIAVALTKTLSSK